ncbi:MAG TPA: thiol reductant ABC exporter subunit CydD [Jatrophihabitantaceae bacterium]|nr:thiol reductant ABC exporter subunit CydD [Jatrophihabitantaceae bacterium]
MSRLVDPRLVRAVPAVRRLLVVVGAGQAIGAVLTVAQAALLSDIVVGVFLDHRSATQLSGRLALLVAVGLVRAGLAAAQEWTTARASVLIRARVRSRALDALVRLGHSGGTRTETGRLATMTGPGLEALDGYVTRALPALVGAVAIPPVVLLCIGIADWQSALLLLVVLPLVPLFMALVGLMTRRYTERQYRTLAALSGHFLDLVRGLTTLKVYGQGARQTATVRRATDLYRRHTMAALRTGFLSGLVLDLLATLSIALIAVDVGLRLDHGSLRLAPALFVLLLTPEVFAPLRAMGAQHHAAEDGRVAAAAALDLCDAADSAQSAETGVDVARCAGRVRFHSLRVCYAGRERPALDDVTFAVEPGELVAVQGPSGAGKSTLLAALAGFVRPESGSVVVSADGGSVALSALDLEAWRKQLAWVSQRPRLTQPTVAAEVALGDPSAGPDRIERAIARCQAPPADSIVGEDGSALSAGQRRRVALARALMRAWRVCDDGSVPIVLLDEPSEDLDRRTEAVVASVLADLAGRATVLVATHSNRLARVADRRIVIDSGRLVSDEQLRPDREICVPAPLRVTTNVPTAELQPGPVVALPLRAMARKLAPAAALSGVAGLVGLALTATSIWLICRAAQHPNVQELAIAVVGVRTFALARALLRYAERLASHDSALRLLAQLRVRVFEALQPLVPFATGDLRRGDLLRRFVSDVDGVQEGLIRAVVPFVGAAITSAGAVALATALAPGSGLVLAIGVLAGLVAAPALSRVLAGNSAQASDLAGRRDAMTSNLADGLPDLVAYGAARSTVRDIESLDTELLIATRRSALAAAAGVALSATASAVTMPLVLAAGARAVTSGALSGVNAGVLVACVLVAFEVIAPLPSAFAAWSAVRAGAARVADVLNRPVPLAEPGRPGIVPRGATGLAATAASVAPSMSAADVLHEVDLTVRPGERVALVGASGCGKSTLLSALLRLTPVHSGEVVVERGGTAVNVDRLRAADMPPLVAGSLQGDHVFDASLADNLRVVRPDATDAHLQEVARRVRLSDFIEALPDGWHTPAGPDGAALSGGQRQRLLLARALLADPDVLVLDEPTAHLDADTERAVLLDLLRATRGRTIVMSSHRRLHDGDVDAVYEIADGRACSRSS